MHLNIPDDLSRRLEDLAGKGQDVQALVCEAIEARLAIEEQLEKNLEGWTEKELHTEVHKGLDDLARGDYTAYDETTLHELFKDIKTRGRERLAARNQHPG